MRKNTLFLLFLILLFTGCQTDDNTAIQSATSDLSGIDITLTAFTDYAQGILNFPFSTTGARSVLFEFNGTANPSFIIEGSNDLENWFVVPIYTTDNPKAAITGVFLTAGGKSLYGLQSVTTKFCRVRETAKSTVALSKIIAIHIKYNTLPKVVKFNGDSLTAGAGSTNNESLPNLFQNDFKDYLIVNDAIGGQNSTEILSRQGGIPVTLTVEGNALNGGSPKNIISISSDLLYKSAKGVGGWIDGNPVMIAKSNDNYTIRAADPGNKSTIAAASVFLPYAAQNYKSAINVFWIGRNDNDYSGLLLNYPKALATLDTPNRFIAIGVLPGLSEVSGTSRNTKITTFNNSLRDAYPNNYVEILPPSLIEMAAIGYVPDARDLVDVSKGVFPAGMRSDGIHLNSYGYKIIKNRLKEVFLRLGY